MKNEHRVLTPESVEFVYELAGLGSRMLAVFLDHLFIVGILFAIWTVACVLGPLGAFMFGPVLAFARFGVFLVVYFYFAYFEWRWNGQTPGKRLLDLRVIDDRGMNVDLFQALVRTLFRLVDMMPFLAPPGGVAAQALEFLGLNAAGFYAVGGLCALMHPAHKRLGDWAAGTLVVRTRRRVMPAAIIAPNDRYNTLQEDAGVRSRIRSRLTLEERETLLQLCLRRQELELDARRALFAEAAAYLEERLDLRREAFMSEEKFVQNIAAVALAAARTEERGTGAGPLPVSVSHREGP